MNFDSYHYVQPAAIVYFNFVICRLSTMRMGWLEMPGCRCHTQQVIGELDQELSRLLACLDAAETELRERYISGDLEQSDEDLIVRTKDEVGRQLYDLAQRIVLLFGASETRVLKGRAKHLTLIAAVVQHYAEPQRDIVHQAALALAQGVIDSGGPGSNSG